MSSQAHEHGHGHDMTNSHLLVQEFEYDRPATIEQAVALLAERNGQAALLAGGTFLLVQMKMERMSSGCLIDISGLPQLSGIRSVGNCLEIGGTTTIWRLRNAAPVRRRARALADACAAFGSTQIQLTGTVGGNICNGSPASDTVPALVALGAEVDLVGPEGERTIRLEQFLIAPGSVALSEAELLKTIRVPVTGPGAGSAFVKVSRVRADLAKASAAAVVERDEDRIGDCRLALGAVGPTVLRAREAEEVLIGERFSSDLALKAGRTAARNISPIDDVRSSARYRRKVVAALTHDALEAAWQRAAEGQGGTVVEDEGVRDVDQTEADWTPLHLASDERCTITLTVNGVQRRMSVRSNDLLINLLRDQLNLTGTKYGCGIGECGACTVHVDGVPALSCLTLAVAVDGREVTTVEGLEGPSGEPDRVQEAFVEHAAFQCGYCTPGMLMMTKRLLAESRAPDEGEVRDYLKGNRCRCTGFAAIVRAVRSCAETQSPEPES